MPNNNFPIHLALKALDGITGVFKKIESASGTLSNSAKKIGTSFAEAQERTKGFRVSMEKVGKSITGVGKKMSIGVTAPLLAFGGFAIKTGIDFENAMENLEVRAGLTGEALKEVAKSVDHIVTGTKFTSAQAVDGVNTLVKAGFKLQDAYKVLPNVIQLATANQMELGDAAKVTATVLRAYNLSINDSAKVNDLLTKTTSIANLDLLQLADALKQAGPLTSSMGMSLADTTGILAQFAQKNIEGAEAGDLLRKAIAKLVDPSNEAKKALVKLHISRSDILDSHNNVRSFSKILELLSSKGANAAQVMDIFGNRLGPSLVPLVKDGAASMKDFISKLSGPASMGEAARVAKIRLEGTGDQLEKFKASYQNFSKAVSDSGLLDAFGKLLDVATRFLDNLKEANPALLKWGTIIGVVAAALGPLLVGFGFFVTLIPKFVTGWALLKPVFMAMSGIFSTTALSIGVIVAGFFAWASAIKTVVDNWKELKEFFTGTDRWDGNKWVTGATNLAALGPASSGPSQVKSNVNQQFMDRTNNAAVSVDFSNLPRESKVISQPGKGPLNLSLGFAGALD